MIFRVINGNGYFLYGKESIQMRPWQIVDLEGHPYYAFLPVNQIPKSARTSHRDFKQFDSNALEVSVIDVKENDGEFIITSDVDDVTYNDALNSFYATEMRHESALSVKNEILAIDKDELDENEFDQYDDKIVENEFDESKLGENDDNMVYNCDECNICFPELRMLKQHRKAVHEVKIPQYKCKLCLKICRSLSAYRMHMKQEHWDKQSDTDEQTLASVDQKQQQQLTKIYRCDYCDYECSNKSTFHSHVSKKHPVLFAHNKRRSSLRMKVIAKPEEYMCDTCGFKFPNRRRLKEHLERKHASGYKYDCEYCGKKFKVKSDMRLHVRFKHKEGPIVCDVCGKTCANSNSLYVHQKWAHFKPKYECEICKRRMVTQENLDQHILLQHERKESFVCEECGKSFSENHRLKQHMMTHTGDRPHDCHICGRAFARRTAYRQHLLIHTGKRPYVCDICGKAFTQKPGLICHRKSHPGVHPPLPIVHIEHILSDFMKKK